MASIYEPSGANPSYHRFWIWDTETGDGIRWQWTTHQEDNFVADYARWDTETMPSYGSAERGAKVTLYPLQATVLRSTVERLGAARVYTIYDPTRDETWVGDARFSYDSKNHVTVRPLSLGTWKKGKINP
jgi:hypothetical protein